MAALVPDAIRLRSAPDLSLTRALTVVDAYAANLLLAEGRSVHYVARQLGHSPALTLSTYGHLFAEYEHADRIDAESEIAQARRVRRPAARDLPARYPRPA